MGIVAGPRVGLEVELKLNLPSSCEETNKAAGLAIGGAGGSLPVQVAGWEEEEEEITSRHLLLCFSTRSSQRKAARIAWGGSEQTVSEQPLWESFFRCGHMEPRRLATWTTV